MRHNYRGNRSHCRRRHYGQAEAAKQPKDQAALSSRLVAKVGCAQSRFRRRLNAPETWRIPSIYSESNHESGRTDTILAD